MKRLYFIFVMLLAAWAAQATQVTRTYTLNFNQGDFTYTIDDHLLYISSNTHVVSFDTDPLLPAMPYIGVSILVRPYEDYSSFNIQKTETLIQNNVLMGPNPKVVPVSMMPEVLETTPTPNYRGWIFPTTDMSYTGSYTTDGYKVICFRLCPFRYNAIAKKLYLATSVTLSVTLDSDITPIGHGIPIYPVVTGGSNMQETNQTLAPTYERLAEWKEKKGIRTKILTVEYIDSTDTSEDPMPLKIKRALKEYYHQDMKYVLLGGGVDVVPSEICFIWAKYGGQLLPCVFPSDLYYGCFENDNWDTNGNGLNGELADSLEIIPAVGVARIPISNATTLGSYIEKLITYECNPDTTNWQNKMLLCGRYTYNYFTISPGVVVSDTHENALTLIEKSVNHHWQGDVHMLFDTGNNIGWNGGFITSKLQDELEKRYSFVCVDTHGDTDHWQMDTLPNYRNTDALNLINTGNTLITTKACLTNNFADNNCLGAAFLKNSQSGVLGYWGSSTFSWDASGYGSLGDSGKLMAEFYKYIFDGNNTFADAVNNTKIAIYNSRKENDTVKTVNHLAFNILGDPTMQIFTKKPKRYSGMSIYTSDNALHVEVGPNDAGDMFTLIREYDGEIQFEKLTHYSGVAFSNYASDNGMCRLAVTHPDYIPYLAYYGNTIYLQNETLEGDNHIWAVDKTIIGSQQAPFGETGPVVVKNGSTTVNLANGVTINDSFSVEVGATFEIKANN